MRDERLEERDHIDRAVLAIGTDYERGEVLAAHRHRRAQLLYGVGGVMDVRTEHGAWTVPSERAVLIPAGTEHAVTMWGVSTRSLYIEPAAAPWFPRQCVVVGVTPLLRELLSAAKEVPVEYAIRGRDGALMTLILHEIVRSVALPLELPLPVDPALRRRCEHFLRSPDVHRSSRWWGEALHVSDRTVERRFRGELSMGVSEWQRRACVLHALRRLGAGDTIGAVAGDLGYASPAAFSTMFRRVTGSPPNAFRAERW